MFIVKQTFDGTNSDLPQTLPSETSGGTKLQNRIYKTLESVLSSVKFGGFATVAIENY